jgi:hypothetical protein
VRGDVGGDLHVELKTSNTIWRGSFQAEDSREHFGLHRWLGMKQKSHLRAAAGSCGGFFFVQLSFPYLKKNAQNQRHFRC